MDIGERINFNAKVIQYCLNLNNWKMNENQDEALDRFQDCMTRSIIAEQLFRAELNRTRPGIFKEESDE